ncbi:MAG: glycosyltransferase family 39 protein [Elusimicrobiota bacterium]|jgi:hypothetical protein
MNRRLAAALCALAFAVLAFLLLRRLSDFPGLHGDEAWVGLYAVRILKGGLYSPHEMNTYTGPLYGWLLSGVYRLLGASVFSLRLPGALLNLFAAGLLAGHFWRREGPRSSLLWLALLLGSPLFLLKSRVAWEVYALQPLLLALVFAASRRALDDDGGGTRNALLFLAACHLGVLNHFIFSSVPVSLLAYAAFRSILQRDARALDLLALAAYASLQTLLVGTLKPRVGDAFWLEHRAPLCAAWLSLPFLGGALYRGLRSRWLPALGVLATRAAALPERVFSSARVVVCVGFAAFVFFHWIAFMQILSGVSVFMRLTSWEPSLFLAVPLYAGAGLSMVVLFSEGLRALYSREVPEGPRGVALWFLCYAAAFPLFRTHSTIRYYILPAFLALAALAVLLPPLLERRAGARAALFAGLLCLFTLSVKESSMSGVRFPVSFHVGWRWENSGDFLPKKGLYDEISSLGYCEFHPDSFIGLPMIFYLNTEKRDCSRSETVRIEVCPSCPRPYFRWEAPGR